MNFLHYAVQTTTVENATVFFEGILGLKKIREYELDKNLCREIFGIEKNYKVVLYELENGAIEVFIGKKENCISLTHIALSPNNREGILKNARKYGLWIFEKERKEKDKLVFIKDFDGNLYELKSAKSTKR